VSQRASRDHGECGAKDKRERSASQRAGHSEHELGGLTVARTAGAADSSEIGRREQVSELRKDKANSTGRWSSQRRNDYSEFRW
jgi:hypothetical protein